MSSLVGAAVPRASLYHDPDCLLHLALASKILPTNLYTLPHHGKHLLIIKSFGVKGIA
jgi:hypothetical protein